MQDFMVNIALPFAMFLFIAAVALAVLLSLYTGLKDPQKFLKSLIGAGVLVVVLIIGYVFAGNEVTPVYTQFGVDASLSKTIGGMLNTTYILFIVAILGIAADSILKFIR
ncbi:MAG: hypothetical protein NZ521_01145 [Flammeovirgaceae bacterium]|nr:hypothetical protein [Flammeovirgaceae bacterium]MDW8286718.1 hypothetical protein [Flammeovirgaceae bacterium]